jgi:hypothetical protein
VSDSPISTIPLSFGGAQVVGWSREQELAFYLVDDLDTYYLTREGLLALPVAWVTPDGQPTDAAKIVRLHAPCSFRLVEFGYARVQAPCQYPDPTDVAEGERLLASSLVVPAPVLWMDGKSLIHIVAGCYVYASTRPPERGNLRSGRSIRQTGAGGYVFKADVQAKRLFS